MGHSQIIAARFPQNPRCWFWALISIVHGPLRYPSCESPWSEKCAVDSVLLVVNTHCAEYLDRHSGADFVSLTGWSIKNRFFFFPFQYWKHKVKVMGSELFSYILTWQKAGGKDVKIHAPNPRYDGSNWSWTPPRSLFSEVLTAYEFEPVTHIDRSTYSFT